MKKKLLLFIILSLFTSIANAYDFKVDDIYYSIQNTTDKTCYVTDGKIDDWGMPGINEVKVVYSGDITIPAKVTYEGQEYTVIALGPAAFAGCNITSISLPNTITWINYDCFKGCQSLKTFKVPSKVTEIPPRCFSSCTSLQEIDLNNTEYIEDEAFSECSKLEKLTIPASVREIEDNAFYKCNSLTQLIIENKRDGSGVILGANRRYDEISNKTLYSPLFEYCPIEKIHLGRHIYYRHETEKSPFENSSNLRSVTIGVNVWNINDRLFRGASKLEDVSGMEFIEFIGDSAFFGCKKLTYFNVGNRVKQIGKYAFGGCEELETLVIGDGIKSLETDGKLTLNCPNLKNIYLGKGIKSIGRDALTSSNQIGKANIYLFSDSLSSCYIGTDKNGYIQNGLPTNANAIYVSNPKLYETLLGQDYNVLPLLTFKTPSLEYSGKTPTVSYQNNVEGCKVSFDTSKMPIDAGTYNAKVSVCFSDTDWNTTVDIPIEYSIRKAPLAITAEDARRTYKEENPEFTCSYVGFKNDETSEVLDVQPTMYTTATTESDTGTYPIYCSGAEAKNYELIYNPGTLTIDKADQKITWDQEFKDINVSGKYALTGASSSGLPVRYRTSSLNDVSVTYDENTHESSIYIHPRSTATSITLTAFQNGNKNYNEAEVVEKTFNVLPTGIDSVTMDNDAKCTYYNLNGQKVDKSTKGILIVKDGNKAKRVINK